MSGRLMRLALTLAVLAFACGVAGAAPSFFGYSGLIRIPTAEAIDEGQYNLGAFGLDVEEAIDSSVYFANIGMAEALEVGFTRLDPEDGEGETWVNAKYRFMSETEAHPAIAAGVFDFTDEVGSTTYIVLSKSFTWRGTTEYGDVNAPQVHFGVAGGQIDGIFGGVSVALGNRLLVFGEHDSEEINFGARLAVTPEIRVHAGFLNGGDDFGIGVTFNK